MNIDVYSTVSCEDRLDILAANFGRVSSDMRRGHFQIRCESLGNDKPVASLQSQWCGWESEKVDGKAKKQTLLNIIRKAFLASATASDLPNKLYSWGRIFVGGKECVGCTGAAARNANLSFLPSTKMC